MKHFSFLLVATTIRTVPAPALFMWLLAASGAAADPVKAFPTAEGFGANARGGRGGRVIEVTNLEDAGPGSLRAAMEASGPRIVVFRVSGTITLKNAIQVRTPYLTVAGQTSPGGVQIKGHDKPEGDWGVWFVNGAHDIVVRHLRVRMGGNLKHDAGNNLLCYGTAEPGVHDVIFDHCSVSWGSDTQLDWYGSYLDRATFQGCLLGECFMGQHIGGNRAPKNITLHHNLYANLGSRTPLMQHADVFDFVNNVIYNWAGNNASVFGQFALNSSAFGNVVSNLWLAGPESGYPYLNVGNGGPARIDGKAAEAGGTRIYVAGNWGPRSPTGSTNDWIGHGVNTWDYYELNHDGSTHLVNQTHYDAGKPFAVPPVSLDPVSSLLDKVLITVGASRPSRDPIDQRIVQSVRDKTGTSRGHDEGPWPDLATGAPPAPADSDHDGMPDAWEKAHGLNPNDASDGAVVAGNSYTHVENYLNELAGDPIPVSRGAKAEALKLIFDTDMDGDNDDVAAVAILHALADAGEVEILAIGVVSRHPYSPACLDAINTYYGRGDIPIGVFKAQAQGFLLAEIGSSYAKIVSERCPHDLGLADRVPDVLTVYRRALAAQPDSSVAMIAVGQMNNLVNLLASPPDEHSDLPGRELVKHKVAALFVMAPYFNERNDYQRAYNFVSSPQAAVALIENWPTKIKFGEGNLGHRHFIGSRLKETPADNPVRIAFEAYFDGQTENKRHCADPTTVLYAVCGTRYFGEVGPGACDVRADGFTRWHAGRDRQHFYNTQKLPVGELEQVMEQLLIKPSKLRR